MAHTKRSKHLNEYKLSRNVHEQIRKGEIQLDCQNDPKFLSNLNKNLVSMLNIHNNNMLNQPLGPESLPTDESEMYDDEDEILIDAPYIPEEEVEIVPQHAYNTNDMHRALFE